MVTVILVVEEKATVQQMLVHTLEKQGDSGETNTAAGVRFFVCGCMMGITEGKSESKRFN
jgi:hypothetical protein